MIQLCAQSPELIENETLEIKGWCNDERELAEKLVEAATCLANARGGLVLVGVDTRRGGTHFSQCPHPNVTPSWIVARIQDLSIPPVTCVPHDATALLSEIRGTDSANAFFISIPPTKYLGGHHTTRGLSKIRVGKECRPHYTVEDDRTCVVVPGITLDDLSSSSIKSAIALHRKKFGSGENFDNESFLAASRLLERKIVYGEEKPHYEVTLACLILFGTERVIQRTLPQFETIFQFENSTTRFRTNMVETLRHLTLSDRPLLRNYCPRLHPTTAKELLVNAFVHRCWRTGGPIVIKVTESEIEIQNPGELLPGLQPENLIHCIPAYRNFLLADGARFIGLCDKIGLGIDQVFNSVLSGGFGFPIFESGGNQFTARLNFSQSPEFAEFIRRRSSSLGNLDEIIILRLLWSRDTATFKEIASAIQRSPDTSREIISQMEHKLRIEPVSSSSDVFRLENSLREDIRNIFKSDQFDLFGKPLKVSNR